MDSPTEPRNGRRQAGAPPMVWRMGKLHVNLTVNGEARELVVEPGTTLLEALRDGLGLTGTKKSCDRGECGACTVHRDGRRILSCMTLAAMQEGRHITTIEGLGRNGELHPLQQAFIEHDGFQCGFCTPGQIMSAVGMLSEVKRGVPSHVTTDLAAEMITLTREELSERMSGNLCRCGAYNGIVDAITAYDHMGAK